MKKSEDNNGWIKVEDVNSLPNEMGDYWIITEDCVEPVILDANRLTDYDGFWGDITHYKLITKPDLPLW